MPRERIADEKNSLSCRMCDLHMQSFQFECAVAVAKTELTAIEWLFTLRFNRLWPVNCVIRVQLIRCTDFVRLFLDLELPEVNEQKQWNYELCGNSSLSSIMQRQFFSSTPNLILEFHTDHVQTNNTGFRGVYKFIDRCKSTLRVN